MAERCKFDRNGECLVCDCYFTECAYVRYINRDYRWETREELERMFQQDEKNKSIMNRIFKNSLSRGFIMFIGVSTILGAAILFLVWLVSLSAGF